MGILKDEQIQCEKKKKYYPVAIITCNRATHLRNCIESLSRCTYADRTELYISVDYPPDESYLEGWKEVKEYLRDIQGFLKVNVWIHERNLDPFNNEDFVEQKIFEKYDALIFTEDDNVFAPDFLDYMNQMLCRFERDPKVYAVCGFNRLRAPRNSRIFKNYTFQPWGVGLWKDKWNYVRDLNRAEVYDKSSRHIFKIIGLYVRNKWLFCVYVGRLLHEKPNGDKADLPDGTLTLLFYLLGLYAVFPDKSLTKNNGFDDSGINCKINEVPDINEIELDDKPLFHYNSSGKVPVSRKWYLPIPEWAKKSAKLRNDPLTYVMYYIMKREKYLEWRKRKGL